MDKNIPASLDIWLDPDGTVRSELYVGEYTDTPAIEAEGRLMVMIDDLINSMTLLSTGQIAEHHHEECNELIKYFEEVAQFVKQRVEEKL